MSRLYGDQHRDLQDSFDSRAMADRVEQLAVSTEIDDGTRQFIESRDMFFLTTIDHKGRPTVSYKGGQAGHFVKVIDDKTLAFPSYDGNGMYFSMGNIQGNPEIGLLFIDFEKPHRIRVQGTAQVSATDPLLKEWKEADMVVRLSISVLWRNCPRYIHRYEKVKTSHYVPNNDCETPIATWKRVHEVQDVLKDNERHQVDKAGGAIPIEEWVDYVQKGDDRA